VGYRVEPLPVTAAAVPVSVEPAHAPVPLRDDINRGAAGDPPYLRIRAGRLEAYLRQDNGIVVGLRSAAGPDHVAYGMCRGADYLDAARPDLALGVLQVIDELPHGMSAWHLDEVAREESLLGGAQVRVVACGPVRAVVDVTHRVRASTIRLRLSFWAALGRIDTDAEVDWQEPGGPDVGVPGLKASFTARLPEVQAWYETPGSATTRPADGQEVPASRWADVSGGGRGMALLNRGRHGHDALGPRLRLTLVRSSYEPDAVAGPGRYATSWSLLPHAGDWREAQVPRQAAGYDTPLLAHVATGTSAPAPWRPALEGDDSVLLTAKPAYDGVGTLLRLQEAHGRPASVRLRGLPPASAVARVAVTEQPADGVPQQRERDGALLLRLRPFEIAHLLVAPPSAPHA
jgi:alpha-mannosidase